MDGVGGLGGFSRRRFFEQVAAVGGVSLAMSAMDALGFGFSSALASNRFEAAIAAR